MDNLDSLPQESLDRGVNQLTDTAAALLNWTSQDNQSFRNAQSNQSGDLNLNNNIIKEDEQKPVVERTGHDIGKVIVGGILGGIASELLYGGHRPYYPPPVYRPYPYPYPNYPQPYPRYPAPYPVPVPIPGWGHGHHRHGGHHHGGHRHRR